MRDHGLADEIVIAMTSYTEEGGHQGARELLARSPRPAASLANVSPALVPRRSTGPSPRSDR